MAKKAIIIGAGPAGLTAAYELLKRTDIIPVILEKSGDIGGISKTINYKGNRMDMGPHRFFSKSDRVMDWWLSLFPVQTTDSSSLTIHYQHKSRTVDAVGKEDAVGKDKANKDAEQEKLDSDKVMVVIQRLTRIYFLRKFFAYPIQLSINTLRQLGLVKTMRIIFSYLWVQLFPCKPEKSLEDFIINKFGRQLYLLFFKDYTEKVWGVPCHSISAEWGAQRIKGVSLSKAIAHALQTIGKRKGDPGGIGQKGTETSLIEQFLYPKKGPGQLWEEVARQVEAMGGRIYLNQDVQHIYTHDNNITGVNTVNSLSGQTGAWEGEYFFSTMPVQELIAGIRGGVPAEVQEIAAGLQYRDFINAGILLKQLSAPVKGSDGHVYEKLHLKDNWIYIQERDVKVGRLMIYNNWGDGMVKDPNTTWIGMEYFCNKTDEFWKLSNSAIEQVAILELEKMGLARKEDVLDITIQRMEKTYPAYFGTYHLFDRIRNYTDQFENLFLVGRNGMHKYNNADHSMLTAMVSVDNIIAGVRDKENIWAINTEQEYHEEKAGTNAGTEKAAAPEGAGNREIAPAAIPTTSFDRRTRRVPKPDLAPSFMNYIWGDKWNRRYLLFALAAFLIQFILFKTRYPFANYMPDSYSYLDAAYRNVDVNTWPVAYSKFLRVISAFTHSDKIVVGIQYLFMQCSGLVFLYTLLYFIQPGKVVKNILYAFFLLNPVALYVSNYISADALFIGLSLLWMSQLLWIIYRPRPYQLFIQAILLLAVFTVRYNAIYYPLIAAFAFILSRQSWKLKVGGIALGTVLVIGSVLYTSQKMQEMTGKRQFSAFSGWQLANNALYMYQHIPAADRGPVPAQFAKLEGMVREHMDTLKKVTFTAEDSATTFYYLWNAKSPLVQYMVREWGRDSITQPFKRWASEGPLYNEYALWLIRKYPLVYASEFVLPNALKYAYPPPEFLGVYNMGADSVGALAKEWFNYKTLRVQKHGPKNAQIGVTQYYSWFSTLANVFFLITLIGLAVFTGFRQGDKGLFRIMLFVLFFWLLNMGFSILASPVVLRYQVFPVLVSFSLAMLAAESIYNWGVQEDLKKKNQLV